MKSFGIKKITALIIKHQKLICFKSIHKNANTHKNKHTHTNTQGDKLMRLPCQFVGTDKLLDSFYGEEGPDEVLKRGKLMTAEEYLELYISDKGKKGMDQFDVGGDVFFIFY